MSISRLGKRPVRTILKGMKLIMLQQSLVKTITFLLLVKWRLFGPTSSILQLVALLLGLPAHLQQIIGIGHRRSAFQAPVGAVNCSVLVITGVRTTSTPITRWFLLLLRPGRTGLCSLGLCAVWWSYFIILKSSPLAIATIMTPQFNGQNSGFLDHKYRFDSYLGN